MTAEDRLREDYVALLHSSGHVPRPPLTAEDVLAFRATLPEHEYAFFADNPLPDGTKGPFDHIAEDFRRTLRAAGVSLPEPVLVEEYPHAALNAQARATPNGTLILINTGFTALVFEICKAHGLSVRMRSDEEIVQAYHGEDTEDDRRRQRAADSAIASVVLAYLLKGDARFGIRLPLDTGRSAELAWLLTESTRRFVIAHEFAHLLEGHLSGPGRGAEGDWLSRTRTQEFQADRTGALLCLRALRDPSDQVMTYLTVAGPMLFLAIDHLITRVQNELDGIPPGLRLSDHPTSDERGAALRSMFQEIYGTSVLQIADACVYWLSWRENDILAQADRLLRG
jgi:hypothetical protein